MFMEGLRTHGKEWKTIAQMVETRTVVQIRTHAQKYFQKLAKMGVTDPIADITSGHLRQKITGNKRRRSSSNARKATPRSPRSPPSRRVTALPPSAALFNGAAGAATGLSIRTPVPLGHSPAHRFTKRPSPPQPPVAVPFDSHPEPGEFEAALGPAQLLGAQLASMAPTMMMDDAAMDADHTVTSQSGAFVVIPSLSDYVGNDRCYGMDPLTDGVSFPEGSPTGVTDDLMSFPSVPDDGRISPVAPLADLLNTDPLDGWLSEDSCGTSESVESARSQLCQPPRMKKRRTALPRGSRFDFDADSFVAGLLQ